VKSTGQRVPGPRGAVDGAMVIRELHMDSATEEKTFAPGYGEFSAGGGGDLEAVALAVPVDAASGSLPPELAALAGGARSSYAAAGRGRWAAASSEAVAMAAAWKRVDRTGVPELLAGQITGALGRLAKAVAVRDPARARQAALAAEQAALDLQLRHRAPAAVDLDRLDLRARQLLVDAAAGDRGTVAGDVAVLHTVWDRAGHTVNPAAADRVADSL
jgi:hypothetical protein